MDRDACATWDREDDLAWARGRFDLPPGVVYLDGNSLGPVQHAVRERVAATVDAWRHDLIAAWNDDDWVHLPRRVAARIAPLVGADPDEVAVSDSTTVDLFKVLHAAVDLRPGRRVILTETGNFPTDLHVADGVARARDLEVRPVPADGLGAALTDEVAVLYLTHVDYRTGGRHDARHRTAAAHAAGALVVWDLSHTTGAVDVDLTTWRADLAVGCTYKFLNGGPGAPAYAYVAARHLPQVRSPIQGWFGHAAPFDFDGAYHPARTADRLLAGTPPVLSLAALDAALGIWDDVPVRAATAKARALTRLFRAVAAPRLDGTQASIVTPQDRHGAQVSIRHPDAYAVVRALAARGVVGDHRPPDIVRLGFSPLFLRAVDVYDAATTLAEVVRTGAYDRAEYRRRRTVT